MIAQTYNLRTRVRGRRFKADSYISNLRPSGLHETLPLTIKQQNQKKKKGKRERKKEKKKGRKKRKQKGREREREKGKKEGRKKKEKKRKKKHLKELPDRLSC